MRTDNKSLNRCDSSHPIHERLPAVKSYAFSFSMFSFLETTFGRVMVYQFLGFRYSPRCSFRRQALHPGTTSDWP